MEGLSQADRQLMVPQSPRCSTFYLLPKIHKTYELPNSLPPGRPIVSSYSSLTERLSAYVDFVLQPISTTQPSFIKDSYHFLDVLREIQLPDDPPHPILLVSIDVTSLYTSIRHSDGLRSLERFLDAREDSSEPSTAFILSLAEFILTHNYFEYAGEYFLQLQGTAMGTKFAPSYANLYLAGIEQDFLGSRVLSPLVWRRFLDDVFMIWQHGLDELEVFMRELNAASPLSFTYSASSASATFLDVDVFVENDGFRTDVHIKPTNAEMHLHYSSCHPPHTKRAIPRSLSIRGHRICNKRNDLEIYLNNLTERLSERGYPRSLLRRQIIPPEIDYQPAARTEKSGPFLVTTFFPGVQKIEAFLRELYPILANSPDTRDIFPDRFCVSFKRPKNLGDLLTRKHPLTPPEPSRGLQRCEKRRPPCKLCPLIYPASATFSSPNTPHEYRIVGSSHCQTPMVVYELLCTQCDAYYVGKTSTQLNLRINNHRHSVSTHSSQPVSVHAAEHGLSFDDCFRIRVLSKLPTEASVVKLHLVEQAHIWVLGALQRPGLNCNS